MKSSRMPGKPGRACRVLVICYTALGAAGSAFMFYVSTLPVTIPDDWPAQAPSWLTAVAYVAATLLGLPWALLPVPLLAAGLVHVRRAASGRGWRTAAWTGALAAGAGLEALLISGAGYHFPGPGYDDRAIVSWVSLAEALGFAAAGVAMIVTVNGAARVRRARTAASAGRWCRVLAVVYTVAGAVSWGVMAFPQSGRVSALYTWFDTAGGPGWLGSVAFSAGLDLSQLWQLLPVPLLITGLVQVRRAAPAQVEWVFALVGLTAAGLVLQAVLFVREFIRPPAFDAVDRVAIAGTAGSLAVGAAMIWVVRRAERTPQRAAAGEAAAR